MNARMHQWVRRLAAATPATINGLPEARRAGLAVVLHEGGAGPEVVVLRRAPHERDAWSGQIGLPGGKREPEDADGIATAIREAREELGLDLTGRHVAPLSELRALARGRPVDLVLQPHVFVVGERPALVPEPSEIAEAGWLPVADVRRHRAAKKRSLGSFQIDMPFVPWRGHEVWGLTLMVLDELAAILGVE